MKSAALFCNSSDPMSNFAAQDLFSSLTENGYSISDIEDLNHIRNSDESIRIVIAEKGNKAIDAACASEGGNPVGSLKPQGYAWRKTSSEKRTTYWVFGADSSGTMYGGLDLAHAIKIDDLESVTNKEVEPFIAQRGIKFNIPLDVRTPGYTDNGSSAWENVEVMWDFNFWKEFFDDCARYHFNVMSLWNMHPFPSMIKVPEYPDVALSDVKKNPGINTGAWYSGTGMCPQNLLDAAVTVKTMTIDEKIAYWKKVMEYGRDRGIEFYFFFWNIFTYGADGKHGITSTPGPITQDYLQKSVRTFLLTYPLIKGIGISSGENMQGQGEPWLWKVYGEGVLAAKADPDWPADRTVRLIHRTIGAAENHIVHQIEPAFSKYPDVLDYSYKYSVAHMLSSVCPPMIDDFLPVLRNGKQTWLTIRTDDFYMMRWGDPQYAREYLANIPMDSGKIAGFYMGPDGYIWGREFISKQPDSPRQLVIKKMWYSFMLWGRLSYDNTIPTATFTKTIAHRFPQVNSDKLFKAWALVSKTIPLVARFKWSESTMDGSWYPESGSRWTDEWQTIDDFIKQQPMGGTNLMSIKAYTDDPTGNGTTPLQVAKEIKDWADSALKIVATMEPGDNKELRLTIGDIKAMAHLGNYYASKILGATYKSIGKKNLALTNMQTAVDHWKSYADAISSQYTPQVLTRIGPTPVDVLALLKNVQAEVELLK